MGGFFYDEDGETLTQIAQRGGGCPIPGNIQGPFQGKVFHDSVIRRSASSVVILIGLGNLQLSLFFLPYFPVFTLRRSVQILGFPTPGGDATSFSCVKLFTYNNAYLHMIT